MRRLGAMIILLLAPAGAMAAPRSNYELPIGDGYSVSRDTDDGILRDSRSVLFLRDYPGVSSSIERYAATRTHIFIQGERTRVGDRVAPKAFFILAEGSFKDAC